jgi:AcrR family transcriptional regulator
MTTSAKTRPGGPRKARSPRPEKRAYAMRARAESAEQTTRRVHTAAAELFAERPFGEVTLRAVAERAGVTLQTVLRKFGSKEALFEATAIELQRAIFAARAPARPGDVRSAIEALVASYEAMGDLGWRGLCQEDQFDFVRDAMREARKGHRAWIEASFAPLLPDRGPERDRRVLLIFAATDYYVWKLYRRDLALGRATTIERMTELCLAASRG